MKWIAWKGAQHFAWEGGNVDDTLSEYITLEKEKQEPYRKEHEETFVNVSDPINLKWNVLIFLGKVHLSSPSSDAGLPLHDSVLWPWSYSGPTWASRIRGKLGDSVDSSFLRTGQWFGVFMRFHHTFSSTWTRCAPWGWLRRELRWGSVGHLAMKCSDILNPGEIWSKIKQGAFQSLCIS